MKLLITGAWRSAREHITEIEAMGHEVVFLQWEHEELPCDPNEVEGVICNGLFLHHPIEEFTNLRLIQLTSAGDDRIPMEYVREHGIEIHNAGDTYAIPMSEYIIFNLLKVYRKNKQELTGKRVCIIGTGNVAKYTAKKLKSFECKVVAISHAPRDVEYIDEVRSYDELTNSLREADIVVLAVPPSGKHVIGTDELSQMKETAVIVNVSRGSLIDQKALTVALKEKRIQAAILDVFEVEPLPEDDELRQLDNAILTPHISYVGDGNEERLWEIIRGRF